MSSFFTDLSAQLVLSAALVTFLAGTVKGVTGFAMPMIMISGLSSFIAPELALAALIVPTLVANTWQALRQGPAAARATIRRFGLFLAVGLVALVTSAQMVRVMPTQVLFLLIGLPITAFAAMQLAGFRPTLKPARWIEALIGGFAGFIGGVSGVWGPPTVAYLTAIDTPKADQMRVQGVIYALGAVALSGAHLRSGVLGAATLPFSVLMVVPALAGMLLGLRIQDRFDQTTFRLVTLAVLVVAGANLVRRGLMG